MTSNYIWTLFTYLIQWMKMNMRFWRWVDNINERQSLKQKKRHNNLDQNIRMNTSNVEEDEHVEKLIGWKWRQTLKISYLRSKAIWRRWKYYIHKCQVTLPKTQRMFCYTVNDMIKSLYFHEISQTQKLIYQILWSGIISRYKVNFQFPVS